MDIPQKHPDLPDILQLHIYNLLSPYAATPHDITTPNYTHQFPFDNNLAHTATLLAALIKSYKAYKSEPGSVSIIIQPCEGKPSAIVMIKAKPAFVVQGRAGHPTVEWLGEACGRYWAQLIHEEGLDGAALAVDECVYKTYDD